MTDFLDTLQHSWGTKPEQKKREKEYNAKYYQEHKEKWLNTNRPLTDTISGYQDALLDNGQSYKVTKWRSLNTNGSDSISDQMDEQIRSANRRHGGPGRRVMTSADYFSGSNAISTTTFVKPTTNRKQIRATDKAINELKSNWKIGAAFISDSAKKGADFVKSLFK